MRDLCVDSPAKGGRRLDAYLTRTSPPTAKTGIPAGRGMGSCDTGNQFVESSLGPTSEVGGSTLGYDTGTNGLTCPVGSTRRLGQASLELTHRGRNKWQRCPANGSFSGRPKVSSFFSHATRLTLTWCVGLRSGATGATNSLASKTVLVSDPL